MKLKSNNIYGNSGCKLKIFTKNSNFYVLKKSTNKLSSERLKLQCKKILSFKAIHKDIYLPSIINFGEAKKKFFYVMRFVNGEMLSEYLNIITISDFFKIYDKIFTFILRNKNKAFKDSKNRFRIKKKIKELEKIFKKKDNFTKFKKIFYKLNNYNWNNIETSVCHGDLTLENILVKKEKIYLIDLSKNFIESYYLDYSKILFDFICEWSLRKKFNNQSLAFYSIKKKIIRKIFFGLTVNEQRNLKFFILLDFIRVINYSKDKKTLYILTKSLKKFYDNFNNSMCW